LATDALKKEALNLIKKTAEFNKNIIYYERSHAEGLFENIKRFTHSSISHTEAYNRLKHTEGDLLNYYSTIQENALKKEDVELMLRYVNAVRLAVFAAKAIKDIAHDLNDFSSSANNFIHSQLNLFHEEWSDFDATLHKIFLLGDDIKIKTQMDTTLSDLHSLEHGHKSEILLHLRKNEIKESEASTLLNVHNELFSSKISLMNALINTISNASEEKN
jgi:phosphate:Na+ symporter